MNSLATILILLVTAAVSFIGFKRSDIWERLMFKPEAILRQKQFERMLTSGLIHADWAHLGMNSLTLYLFGRNIEAHYGALTLVGIHLVSIFGGSVLSLILHRHHADYRALGASGGVSGVVFASVFLLPDYRISMMLLPIWIPPYVYAVIFLVASFIAHRRQTDNIGHDAHLGGAIIGLLFATVLYPHMVFAAPWMFALVLGLSLAVLVILIRDPAQLMDLRFNFGSRPKSSERYQRYDESRERREKMEEIDRLLEKVSSGGLQSLSASERKKLERLSKEIGKRH